MDFLFHYTSRQGAQDIITGEKIKTNFRGVLSLTTEICSTGTDAANRLGITGKPVQVVIIIPRCYLPEHIEDSHDPWPIPYEQDDVTGQIQRTGGGVQYILNKDLHLPKDGLVAGKWGVFRLEFP